MDLDVVLPELAREPAAECDVAELAFQLARDEYPDLDVEAYLSELNGMAHEARRFLCGTLESRVAGLCRYLFHEMGFRGNTQHYYDPKNSYLNQVLDLRTGIPITLSVVAMAVGRRAGLDVAGVGLPGHFVAKAEANGKVLLFDPFHGGRQLDRDQCAVMIEQATGQTLPDHVDIALAAPVGLIAQRMLTNLKQIYLKAEDFDRAVRVVGRLRQLAPEDLGLRRDLGASLLWAGQPGKAIDHLSAYLADDDVAHAHADADHVKKLLQQAQGLVARWN
jgi:regulator of sirC expression with transglutaminase-like and TPR domain